MRNICFLLMIYFFAHCSSSKNSQVTNETKVKILAIDSNKLKGFHIVLIDKNLAKDTCQLILMKENLTNKKHKKIKVGKTYNLSLKLLKTTEKITGIGQRLYEHDIFIKGVSVFPAKRLTYETSSIRGLYYLN